MSIEIDYPFDNPNNYNYDTDLIAVQSSKALLKLINNPLQQFTEDYANDTGFTYDSNEAEFVGGKVQQKNKRPTNATFYASYTNNIDGSWGDGILTGTAGGGASVAGGALDLKYSDIRYVDYDANLNADSQQTGCIRLRFRPNYAGSPVGDTIVMFAICKSVGLGNNMILLQHTVAGQINIGIFDSAGAGIIQVNLGAWAPVSGTIYEFEFNWDITTGATRLFLDGNQFGATQVNTGTRDSDINLLVVGSNLDHTKISNFEILDFLIFSTVQHTANYTPDWTNIYEYDYLESKVDLPSFSYTGNGSIQSFDNFVTIGANERYIINNQYWNGSVWAVSNGTYAQASNSADILANLATITISGTINISIVFEDTNTNRGEADNLIFTYTGQIYPTSNPIISFSTTFRCEGIDEFTETSTKTGSDEIKYRIRIGTNYVYWNGTAWITSDGTYAQSTTAADINTNKATLVTSASNVAIGAYLHSGDGSTTPELDNVQILFDFSGDEADDIEKCIIWGYSRDAQGNALNEEIFVELAPDVVEYKNNITIESDQIIITPNSSGYWEVELADNANMNVGSKYIFTINNKTYYRIIPNEISKAFNELEEA